ncbi:MAG TPA: S53 family peptidase [Bacteroidota bacterium]|nr:S53 family peptidase [Bacteroidota bacterium]
MAQSRLAGSGYVKLSGSAKAAPEGTRTETLSADEVLDVTVRIRGSKSLHGRGRGGRHISREEFQKQFGASAKDLSAVEQFAHEHHLTIVESSSARKCVILRGRVKDFENAFLVHLSHYRDAGGNLSRCRSGEISIPKPLEKIVEGVFGLDNRPLTRPMFHVAKHDGMFVSHKASPQSFTPNALAAIYGFPKSATGKGQCIGIIELGGGYRTKDLKAYFKSLKIPLPSVKAVSVDGGLNSPSTADSADGEVMLDIEVAGAVSPGAKIVVYFAPNTDQGFLDAITTAVHDATNKPGVISISWGSAEIRWTAQSLKSFNDAFSAASTLGVTVCAAAGDQGSSDSETDGKVHADFPSSSPFVLACGGTRLTVKGTAIQSEVVWHESSDSATGGGVSDVFPLPDYQKKAGVPPSVSSGFKGRGLPDVAGDADPQTGYNVLVDGQQLVIGGTSAVAPLMAALIARVNQVKGKPVGFIHPTLYANPKLCRDITQGDNITTSTNKGYKAGPGWDPCTGWGVLSGL